MLTHRQLKYITSLQIKKYRQEYGAFVVEGERNVVELVESNWAIELLCCTQAFASQHAHLLAWKGLEPELCEPEQLARMGSFKTNDAALAVAPIPQQQPFAWPQQGITLALDRVRDPGNLGTIIRIADWYGIAQLLCNHHTAELWNPKVLAASMGSYLRVQVHYAALEEVLPGCPHPILATAMQGTSLYAFSPPPAGVLLLGNEAEGLSPELLALAHTQLTIPRVGNAESLNVAVAAGIVCDNLCRRA